MRRAMVSFPFLSLLSNCACVHIVGGTVILHNSIILVFFVCLLLDSFCTFGGLLTYLHIFCEQPKALDNTVMNKFVLKITKRAL